MQDQFAITIEGNLSLTFKNAMLTHDTNFITRMDPYCRLAYKGSVYQTKVHKRGGKNPVWDENFKIPVHRLTDPLKLIVYGQDQDISAHTVPNLRFSDICLGVQPGTKSARGLELQWQGAEAGNLNIEYSWEPSAQQPMQ